MQRILDEVFLTNDARVQRPPTHEQKVYTDTEGNELWVRIYQEEDGYCVATVVTKFPQHQIEVETKYDTGHPPQGVNPVEPCVQGILTNWGCEHFIEFHRTFYLPASRREEKDCGLNTNCVSCNGREEKGGPG